MPALDQPQSTTTWDPMPSLKSRLVALVLRHTRKKAFRSPEGLHAWIAKARRVQDHRPPVKVARRVDITQRRIARHNVYEARPKGDAGAIRIVYWHGGAFCFELTSYHWRLIAEMCERLSARVTVPVYPLAPEHGFDEIFGFGMEVYRQVLMEARPNDLVFMGDSAGGNMAVVLTMMAAREGLPAPARHVLISPGLDMRLENPDIHDLDRLDPWLGIPGGLEAIRLYAPDMDRADWRISPIGGDLSVLPKTLILAGTRDMLTPDTVRFTERAAAAGVNVELVVEPGMIHVWPLIDMPEARRARDRIVAFLKELQADASTDR